MITGDKVTEIFCIADDFCKVFDAQMAKYSFKAESVESTSKCNITKYFCKSIQLVC